MCLPPLTTASLLAEITFRGVLPRVLVLGMVLFAVASAVWFYLRESVAIAPLRRAMLIGLRGLGFGVLGFLLLRPVWITEVTQERPRPVVLLLDNSQSMTLRDPRPERVDHFRAAIAYDQHDPAQPIPEPPTSSSVMEGVPEQPRRGDLLRAVLANPRLNLQKRLEQIGPLQTYLFGLKLRAAGAIEETLTWSDPATALYDAVAELSQREINQRPAAIVLATDGLDNASQGDWLRLAQTCVDRDVPLYVYGIGNARYGAVELREVRIPETLFVDDEVAVPVRWRITGIPQSQVELHLELDGELVGKPKTVTARPGEDYRDTLTFTPTPSQVQFRTQELRVVARLLDATAPRQDQQSRWVSITDRKIRVLVVEDRPRWDYKFLQRAMLRDRRVEADFYLMKGDSRVLQSGPPFLAALPPTRGDLFRYDLVILGDVAARDLGPERQQWIRDLVADGRGLVILAGAKHAPATWEDTPLEELVPIDFAEIRFPIDSGEPSEEYQPQLTSFGRRSPFLQLADVAQENSTTWEALPGWYWYYPARKLRPGAVALLEHPTQQTEVDTPMPLLATQFFGRGRVLYLASDETWRWRYNRQEAVFSRFWGQVVYALGFSGIRGNQRTQLTLAEREHILGQTGRVYARLFDADFRPLKRPKVTARLEWLDAPPDVRRDQTITLEPVPETEGEYTQELPHDRLGRFLLQLDIGESTRLEYRVTLPANDERTPAGLAEDDMRRLAEQTGGAFYREEDLDQLPKQLSAKQSTVRERREILLWNKWMLLLVIGLLSAEWGLRKVTNLS